MFITRHRRTLLRAGVTTVAVASALVLGGCGGDTVGPETGADVEDLQTDPDPGAFDDFAEVGTFVGETVTVSAKVSEVLGPNAFTIADQSGETVLVVYDGTPQNLTVESAVKVTGLVAETFAVGEAEQFAGAEFEDELFTEFNTDPYIQASSITVTPSLQGANGQ